jgi:hypothetical protein
MDEIYRVNNQNLYHRQPNIYLKIIPDRERAEL